MLGTDSADDPAPRIAQGPAGFGVTSLLRHAFDRAVSKKWAATFVDVSAEDPPLREQVAESLRAAVAQHHRLRPDSRRVARMVEIIEDFAGGRGGVAVDLLETLKAIGPSVTDGGVGLVLFFDHVHRRPAEMLSLLSVSHSLAGSGRPVSMIFGGLPLDGSDAPRLDVEALGFEKVDELLAAAGQAGGRRFDPRAVDRIASLSGGTPFLTQSFARGAWNAATGNRIGVDDVDRGRTESQSGVIDEWYGPRTHGLSGTEIRYLKAMDPDLPGVPTIETVGHRVGDSTRLGGGTSQFDDVRGALMRRGLVYLDRAGILHHTLPSFVSYLNRFV